MNSYDVIVIGGGASGMMAATTAASLGKSVLLIDKNERLGRKLLITGKGRCNITNDCDANEFLKNIPTNSRFLYSAISQFSTEDTKNFFESLGVKLKTERGNRVFPCSDKAVDVVDAMVKSCAQNGVKVKKGRVVQILEPTGVMLESGEKIYSTSIIICTGGKSYPLTGSSGDGYTLATSVGHTIVPARASLVPIESYCEDCKDMQGLSLKNVTLSLVEIVTGKKIYSELGEMLFTHFGLSGPLVLSASAHITDIVPDKYNIVIDLKPGLDDTQLDTRILRDFDKFANKDFMNGLGDLLPKKMIAIVIIRSKIPPFTKINQITKEQRHCLVDVIKRFTIPIDGFRPIDEAIITSGGINVKEINPKTMESKLVKGLYFSGEVIDVDAYTGGFNLQIAFSTGYIAGLCC